MSRPSAEPAGTIQVLPAALVEAGRGLLAVRTALQATVGALARFGGAGPAWGDAAAAVDSLHGAWGVELARLLDDGRALADDVEAAAVEYARLDVRLAVG